MLIVMLVNVITTTDPPIALGTHFNWLLLLEVLLEKKPAVDEKIVKQI